MRDPLIGICPLRDEKTGDYKIYPEYADRIRRAGGVPVVLPLTEDESTADRFAEACDGFLFTGGHDVFPALYGEIPVEGLTFCFPERDRTEAALLARVLDRDKPVFGICRGLQFVNVFLGGTLYQDLASQRQGIIHTQPRPYDAPSHRNAVVRDTPLFDVCATDSIAVNSCHHQGVRALAPCLAVSAVAEDGLIEAAFMPEKRFVRLVQWHPELMPPDDSLSRRLFRDFVVCCR